MGWLWNVETLGINKVRKGSAISKPIGEMMQQFLNPYPCQTQNTFCNVQNDRKSESEISVQGLTQNSATKALDNKSKDNTCDKCQSKESRDVNTQYDISDFGEDIFRDENTYRNEIHEKAESINQTGTTRKSEIIVGKNTTDNNEDGKEDRKGVFEVTINDSRKSSSKPKDNEKRKSSHKKSTNENQKFFHKETGNENQKNVFKKSGSAKEKEIIDKTKIQYERKKSNIKPSDLERITPTKSK